MRLFFWRGPNNVPRPMSKWVIFWRCHLRLFLFLSPHLGRVRMLLPRPSVTDFTTLNDIAWVFETLFNSFHRSFHNIINIHVKNKMKTLLKDVSVICDHLFNHTGFPPLEIIRLAIVRRSLPSPTTASFFACYGRYYFYVLTAIFSVTQGGLSIENS